MRSSGFYRAAASVIGVVALMVTGCAPTPGTTNQAPTANAGANQAVAKGAQVTLQGTGTDPEDGTAVTFQWTPPTGINLSSNTAQNPTFQAPNTDTTLSFTLIVKDSQQLASVAATTTVTVGTGGTTTTNAKALIVANIDAANGNSVLSFSFNTLTDLNGNLSPAADLKGAQTLINNPRGLDINTHINDIMVGNDGNNSIGTFGDLTSLTNINGNKSPLGNIQGAASAVNVLRGLAFQPAAAAGTADDFLYVSDAGAPAAIRIFNIGQSNVNTDLNGNKAPIGILTNAAITTPRGVCLDGDTLFIANETPPRVFVYDGAHALNGNKAPDRTIQITAAAQMRDVFITGTNTANGSVLLIVDNTNNKVFNVNKNSNGNNVTPNSTLTVTGANSINSVIVDNATAIGFISDRTGNKIFSYDGLADINTTKNPDRTISGAATQLAQPYNLRLSQ